MPASFCDLKRERWVRIDVVWWLWVAVILQIVSSKEQLSSRECEDLGFTGLALCSDCNTFAEYVKNQITYSGAVLEVCMRKLVFYPEIVGFIEEEKDKFPTVKVQYIFNSPPKLIMLDDEGKHKEIIRIDNWKREHVLQFLREKVKSASY
ncbi:hypothetical protein GH714_004665 [Hevea brasiliensis]|uniref:Selenoprotein F n=1 Tax=Hevea brasiliensis TaxID=3981 RepID=A0A6A6NAQ3_HEVBR|nr:hypothetical protein GH714_004665 [Hevea brasiliensis]